MAQSKKQVRKLTQREIDEMREYEEAYRLYTKCKKVKTYKKDDKEYKADKSFMRRVKATVAAAILFWGGIVAYAKSSSSYYETQECTLATIIPDAGKQTIIIEKDGIEVELDCSNIAIVQGEIKDGANDIITYDQNGNKIEASISAENLMEVNKIEREDLEDNWVIYQVISPEGAELTSFWTDPLNVHYGDFVLGREQHKEDVEVMYPTEYGVLRGNVDEKSLEIVDELITEKYVNSDAKQMVIDTSSEKYAKLKLSSNTNYEKESIMAKIPNGTVIETIGETVLAEGKEWVKILYDGQYGWAETQYLKEITYQNGNYIFEKESPNVQETVPQEETQETIPQEEDKTSTIANARGGVTIIDVSTISPEQLEQLLKGEIPNTLSNNLYGTYDTQSVAGKINGVQIKIGASTYGKEFKQVNYDAYKGLVEVCERLGVPYGFYYYSTSINEKEAKIEADYIQKIMQELRSETEMNYNKLPFAIDRELVGENDRQYKKDVTDETAYIINRLQEDGISEKVLLYMAGRSVAKNDLDQIMDLQKLKDALDNPGDFAIWLCAPTKKNGDITQNTLKYTNMIENEYGLTIVNQQTHLDLNSPSGGKIDINNMDLEYYNEMVAEKENDLIELDGEER